MQRSEPLLRSEAGALDTERHAGNFLARRSRPRETVISAFLFLCGAISILTTIGIVYELGSESLNFFYAAALGEYEQASCRRHRTGRNGVRGQRDGRPPARRRRAAAR